MTEQKQTGWLNNAVIFVGDTGATVCMVWLPTTLAGTKFTSIGYDDADGAFLTCENGDILHIGSQMDGDAYDVEVVKSTFRIHELDDLGAHKREYFIDVLPRQPVMTFGA